MKVKLDENGAIIPDLAPKTWATGIIGKLIKQEHLDKKTISWGREIKVLNKLKKQYKELEFWDSLDLGFKLNSLCYFLSADGKKLIFQKYQKFKLDIDLARETNYDLESEKVGENIKVSKPKSLMDFLK
jgi:hypothetical protein